VKGGHLSVQRGKPRLSCGVGIHSLPPFPDYIGYCPLGL
jgi:hypothetical protein